MSGCSDIARIYTYGDASPNTLRRNVFVT